MVEAVASSEVAALRRFRTLPENPLGACVTIACDRIEFEDYIVTDRDVLEPSLLGNRRLPPSSLKQLLAKARRVRGLVPQLAQLVDELFLHLMSTHDLPTFGLNLSGTVSSELTDSIAFPKSLANASTWESTGSR